MTVTGEHDGGRDVSITDVQTTMVDGNFPGVTLDLDTVEAHMVEGEERFDPAP